MFETQEGSPLQLGAESVLLHHVEDLRNAEDGTCGDCCEGHGRHHHILVNVGRGFLGVLEQFAAADDEPGVRTYSFPINSPKGCPSLKRVGKTGRLVSVYLPAELAPASAPQLTAAQRRVMRAAVRELTRAHKKNPEPGEAQPVIGGAVPDYAGRRNAACPLLTSTSRYVAFGGNGVRKGQGYRLTSPGGWLAKAGYAAGAIAEFLSDLSTLAATLGLTVVGIDANNRWHDLPSLRAMAGHIPGRRVLDRVHLRVYGSADYIERWNAIFEWSTDTPVATEGPSATVARAMADAGVSRRAVAKGVGADPSFFSKVLAGKKPWPAGLAERALGWLSTLRHPSVEAPPHSETVTIPGPPQVLATALANRARGWSIVPIISATKRPPIRWKEFQTRVATETELTDWFRRWPDAGLALVLGPVSNVFAIDVDGPEAHAALVKRLGSEPVAPKTLSGSRKPSRYHLLFTDPGVATRAKATPWHEKLEFRGQGGLVVLPPSLHPSGHRYEWSPGRSPDDLPLPAVPAILREALAPSKPAPRPARRSQATMPVTGAFSPSTAQFLAGTYANGPKWNDRLFEAACDLAGRGYSFDEAEPLLMAGADPWNSDEAERASRTIQSAFAQTRSPGQT
ncbi:MAG: bifunctional DNA primase/polymerase [Planctomycetes bacterium]|nr:bifunctional DNA primase/polymerase [Planctomycetota bacterium]